MAGEFSGKTRITQGLSSRVRDGMQKKLDGQSLLPRIHATLLQKSSSYEIQKCRRIETLILDINADNERWQTLFNDTEHYEVITYKTSTTPSGRTVSIVEYYELGDDLPLAKSLQDLRDDLREE
jgi:hypothetical protein